MAGYTTIQKFRRLEQQLYDLGFTAQQPRHGRNVMGEYVDLVAVIPKDAESLPIYTRDAELFVGTIDELEQWVRGVNWARDYDSMMFGAKHNSNRERKEKDYRNRQIANILKSEKTDNKVFQ